jgi:hypothetical protein
MKLCHLPCRSVRDNAVLRFRDVYPGSRILDLDFLLILDPGSRIPDPITSTKVRDEEKKFVVPFFVATNFTKLKIILFLKC